MIVAKGTDAFLAEVEKSTPIEKSGEVTHEAALNRLGIEEVNPSVEYDNDGDLDSMSYEEALPGVNKPQVIQIARDIIDSRKDGA